MQNQDQDDQTVDQDLFRSLAESPRNLTVLLDEQEHVLYASPAAQELLGLTLEQFRTREVDAHLPSDDLLVIRELLVKAREQPGDEFGMAVRLRGADGEWRRATVYISNQLNDPRVHAFVVTAHQPLTLPQLTARFREREQTLRALLDASPEAALLISPEGTILAANETAATRFGESVESLLGTQLFARLPADLAGLRRGYVQEAISTGRPVRRVELWNWHKFDVSVVPVLGMDGQVKSLAVYGHDLTSQLAAERELQDREAALRALLDANPEPAMLLTADGIILSANQATVRRLGQPMDKLVGSNVFGWLPPELSRTRKGMFELAVREQRAMHYRDESRGTIYDNYVYPAVGADGHVTKYAVFAVNVTEEARAQHALAASEARFQQMASVIPVAFWMVSPDYKTNFYVSPAFEVIYGQSCQELYRDPALWRRSVHPEDLARVEEWWREHYREPTEVEYRIVRPDGTVRWVRDVSFPVLDESGHLIMLTGASEDVTERRARDAQLAQSDKLAGLGLLAGGVAHQLRNPLAIISSWVQLLEEHPEDARLRQESLPRIRAAADRASRVIEALLKFSRPGELVVAPVDVRQVLAEALDLLALHLGSSQVEVRRDWEEDIAEIQGSADLLLQVFTNLAVNACDAMPNGGTLTVTCKKNQEGGVCIQFADTGQGITPQDLPHVFDPFFTTRLSRQGTGLGLVVTHTIIQQHHGTIEVESTVGIGTTFTVRLP
ncbi:MAG TPA: PAS domain S-box protein [Anaerolineae bacterium]|nr:PAS domain S-box protein [Anaerolineae bacterium]